MDEVTSGAFSFHLGLLDHAIVEGIRVCLEDVMPDIMRDNDFQERNGYGQFRWNPIISRLRSTCQRIGWVDFGVCKRGAWKLPVLFHPASRNLITLMTEGTLRDLQRRNNKGTHYLCGASLFNEDVEPQFEQLGLDLPPVAEDAREWIAESQEQLANCVQASVGEIAGHILVLFEDKADKLLSVRAVRLTQKLEISTQEEDWSHLIQEPFAAEEQVQPQQQRIDDGEDESLVDLL